MLIIVNVGSIKLIQIPYFHKKEIYKYDNRRWKILLLSTKYEKYKKIYENKKLKSGNRPVYNFVFGNVLGKKAVFLIQNIFPTTEKYIEEKYTNSNKDVEIPTVVKDEIIRISLRVVKLAEVGTNIPFYDIIEMKKILLENKNAQVNAQEN